jgi:4-hydroxy-2-oxoheptanedioate aldolase
MAENKFLSRLRAGETLLGLCNGLPAPGIIEVMSRGWDFVWIDGQHGSFGYEGLYNAVVMSQLCGMETLLRVPGHEPGILGPMADLSPSALMIPIVNTVEQAKAVVSALTFPPTGTRSYGGRRPIDMYGREYYTQRELMVVTQVETLEAVKNAPEMARIPGLHALFFGPDDMKLQMGLPVNTAITESPKLQEAMKTMADAARSAGKFAGIVAPSGEAAVLARNMGYQIIVGGADVGFLRTVAPAKLTEIKTALAAGAGVKGKGPGSVY